MIEDSVHRAYDEALLAASSHLKIVLSGRQREMLCRHFVQVIETNRTFNLTRITRPEEFAAKHHADSLGVVKWCEEKSLNVKSVLDVGTGAGIPAVAIAVAKPDWQVTAIDGTGKKARFVAAVAEELGITNLTVHHSRAEQFRAGIRFDLVLFKGVGQIASCLRFSQPHLVRKGCAVMYKTRNVPPEETEDLADVTFDLGFGQAQVFEYDLPAGGEIIERSLWTFRRKTRH